jgi:hypothetical protein
MDKTCHRILKTGLGPIVLVLTLGLAPFVSCSMTEPLGARRVMEATVYSALCEYWARCSPDKLGYFPDADVFACADYYNCRYAESDPFEDPDLCQAHIESSPCDSTLSSVTPFDILLVGGRNWFPGTGARAFSLHNAPECRAPNLYPAEGEPCLLDRGRSCASGFCRVREPYRTVGEKLCGVCERYREIGAPCEDAVFCTGGAHCEAGVCVPGAPVGDPCDSDGMCATVTCVHGLCRDIGGVGDLCEYGYHCASGFCENGVCVDSMPAAIHAGDVGDWCETSSHCRLGLACLQHACAKADCVAALEEPCIQEYPNACGEEGYCATPPFVCAPRRKAGESCSPIDSCVTDLACRLYSHSYKCISLFPIGAPCSFHQECESYHCHRDDYVEHCEPHFPWDPPCHLPECDNCGVCAPEPSATDCF